MRSADSLASAALKPTTRTTPKSMELISERKEAAHESGALRRNSQPIECHEINGGMVILEDSLLDEVEDEFDDEHCDDLDAKDDDSHALVEKSFLEKRSAREGRPAGDFRKWHYVQEATRQHEFSEFVHDEHDLSDFPLEGEYVRSLEYRLARHRPRHAPGLRAKRAQRLMKLRESVRTPRPQPLPRNGYVCHRCGVSGHWIEDCKAPRVIVGPPPHYICHLCHFTGHWMEDCGKLDARKESHYPRPPPTYVCKLCLQHTHWVQDCPKKKTKKKKPAKQRGEKRYVARS
jgi:hypothetical protein